MAVTVRIPTPLRTLTGNQEEVEVDAGTVGAIIDVLESRYPGIKDRLCDEKGIRRFVNVFVNDEDIRALDNLETQLRDGDGMDIIPAIAGGL